MAEMWLSRDTCGSGLYTLWVNAEPELNHDGYYKYASHGDYVSLLLVSIHPSKFQWDELKLDRGDCIKLAIYPDGIETPKPSSTESNLILTEAESQRHIVTPHIGNDNLNT